MEPMLATPGTEALVSGSGWTHEFKWDGIRVLVVADGDRHRLLTRNGNDVAVAWPELAPLAADLPPGTVLDGEVVVLDDRLRPDFSRVAARMHVRNELRVATLRGSHPGRLMVFDVLRVAGDWVVDEPLGARRDRLGGLVGDGAAWAVPPSVDDLATILAVVDERGMEGVVSKRVGSRYEPGVRSRSWRKLRRVREADAVVVGMRGVDGATTGPVGSLSLARWDPERADWVTLGSVGSGLTAKEGDRLARLLGPLAVEAPVVDLPPDVIAVRPEVVVRVSYLEATPQGHFRHPVYKAQRHDVDPRDVVDEA
nr:hypothetical protein [Salsipaludibacter albus]